MLQSGCLHFLFLRDQFRTRSECSQSDGAAATSAHTTLFLYFLTNCAAAAHFQKARGRKKKKKSLICMPARLCKLTFHKQAALSLTARASVLISPKVYF